MCFAKPEKVKKRNISWSEATSTAHSYLKSWPNGPPNSCQLEPSLWLWWSWVLFGHPLGLSWLELVWIWSSSNFRPTWVKFSTVGHLSQLSPSCFVIVMWLRCCIQTIEWFRASWLNLAVSFGRCKFSFCNLAWVAFYPTTNSHFRHIVVPKLIPTRYLKALDAHLWLHQAKSMEKLQNMTSSKTAANARKTTMALPPFEQMKQESMITKIWLYWRVIILHTTCLS